MSGTLLATVVRHRGRSLGGVRPPRQVPDTINGPPSSPCYIPGPVSNLPAWVAAGSFSFYGDRHHGYERSARDNPKPRPRLLQPPLPSGESSRRLAPRNQPLSTERVRPTDPVQNGNSKFRPSNSQKERLPSLDRPQGRLLPDSSASLFQEAASLRLERHGLPVQGTMFRPVDRPTGIHESVRGGLFLGSRPRNPPATIPGRLADLVLLGEQDKTTRRSPTSLRPGPSNTSAWS